MADLFSDLFTEILSLLPVQTLLRFRSISKSLKSLIDSHNFTNLHLKNSLNFNLVLCRNSKFYQIDFPNLTTTFSLNHPLTRYKSHIAIHGSCNGILCISDRYYDISLWNPNIGKHRAIPNLPISHHSESGTIHVCVHGLAFDPYTDNYKLLRIDCTVRLRHLTFHSQVRLFNLKTNSWKVLPNMPYAILSHQTKAVFIENSLHWSVIPKLDKHLPSLIAAFNLTQEIFNEVPLPEIPVTTNERYSIDVSLLGECLCMIVSYQTLNYETTKVDVWLMKEYGLKDSWCKLFTLVQWSFRTPLIDLKPLGYSSNRSKVLLEIYHNLFWYDLNSENVTCVVEIPKFHESVICVGSLLPPSLPFIEG